eukprot:CAMPEP_0116146974 /NCGR_PEP_ID=MMETSP0329-20121206/17475_1 /TAXON_ID=697910 /ORGANISM="Pseudo-nitzschia arenysensis, Strain B593" /LENGTH=394 /DNA_ID=CAMNT_0003642807 /DNA_START=38 /DNA_END=1222 /DNA_ORIENTATION=+
MKGPLVLSLILSVSSYTQAVKEEAVGPTVVADKPCFQKGEIVTASFQDVEGTGIWLGLYPKNNVDSFDNLPSFADEKLSEWILSCGRRDNCDEWTPSGSVEFQTDELAYGEYVLTVSGDKASLVSQAHSESFVVDAHCQNRNRWIPARQGDQRSPCPFLNTAANHGFLNRHGANIDIDDMADQLEALYNVDTEFLQLGPIKQMIECDQTYFDDRGVRRFNLDILFDGNCEEHEASMVRDDSFFGFEKSKDIDDRLLNDLMRRNPGENFLTFDNVMDYQADRIMVSRLDNPETEFRHFDVRNMGAQAMFLFLVGTDPTLMTVEKNRLYFFLLDEKLPDDFEPGILRDRPFNPKKELDFTHTRLDESMANVDGMIRIPVELGVKLGHGINNRHDTN